MRMFTRSVIFAVIFLFGYSFGPGQSVVRPVRVMIITEDSAGGPEDVEYHKLFKAELNRRRNVVLRNESFEFGICLTATKLVDDKGRAFGYAAATLLIVKTGRGDRLRFSIDTGPTLAAIARQAASTLYEKEFRYGAIDPTSDDRHEPEYRQ